VLTSSEAVRDKSRSQPRTVGGFVASVDSPFEIEAFGFETAAEICEQWADLVSRSLEPNVFVEPGFALAAQRASLRKLARGLRSNDDAPTQPGRQMLLRRSS